MPFLNSARERAFLAKFEIGGHLEDKINKIKIPTRCKLTNWNFGK